MRPTRARSILAAATIAVASAAHSSAAPTVQDLVRSASKRKAEAVAALLDSGAPINGRAKRNATALQMAAARGHTDVAKLLIERGADVDMPGKRALTPLGWAVRNGRYPVVHLLLRSGAQCEASASKATTPLSLAVAGCQPAIVAVLLTPCAAVLEQLPTAIKIVQSLTECDDARMARLLMPHMTTLLGRSVRFGEEIARIAATASATAARTMLDSLGESAATPAVANSLLATAASLGRTDLVVLARQRGADLNAHDTDLGSPLAAAVAGKHEEAAILLLALGADPRASGVDEAVLGNLRRGAPLPGEEGATSEPPLATELSPSARLMRAAARGYAEAVAELLLDGVDPSASHERWPGDSGWTPLMVAAAAGHSTIVSQLLVAGAPVDQQNGRGRTALTFAAWYGRTAVVATLLAAGADPNTTDHLGQTPLMLAEAAGNRLEIDLLRAQLGPAPVINVVSDDSESSTAPPATAGTR